MHHYSKLSSIASIPTDTTDIVSHLDLFLKQCRRKQTIFYKLTDLAKNTHITKIDLQLHISCLLKQFGILLVEESQLIKLMHNTGCNRSLFYTLFVRIIEILEITKNRLKYKQVSSIIDEEKKNLNQCYSNQLVSGTYKITEIVQIETNSANLRIRKLFHEINKVGLGKESKVKDKNPLPNWPRSVKQIREQKQSQQYVRQPIKSLTDLQLGGKTMGMSCKFSTKESLVLHVKNRGKVMKRFNKLYKPLQIRMQSIQPRSQIMRLKLQRLMQKNRDIQKDIGNYQCEFSEKKRQRQRQREREFRIKTKPTNVAF